MANSTAEVLRFTFLATPPAPTVRIRARAALAFAVASALAFAVASALAYAFARASASAAQVPRPCSKPSGKVCDKCDEYMPHGHSKPAIIVGIGGVERGE